MIRYLNPTELETSLALLSVLKLTRRSTNQPFHSDVCYFSCKSISCCHYFQVLNKIHYQYISFQSISYLFRAKRDRHCKQWGRIHPCPHQIISRGDNISHRQLRFWWSTAAFLDRLLTKLAGMDHSDPKINEFPLNFCQWMCQDFRKRLREDWIQVSGVQLSINNNLTVNLTAALTSFKKTAQHWRSCPSNYFVYIFIDTVLFFMFLERIPKSDKSSWYWTVAWPLLSQFQHVQKVTQR